MHKFAAFQCNEILDQFGSKFHTTTDSPSKHSFVLVEKRDGMILKIWRRPLVRMHWNRETIRQLWIGWCLPQGSYENN
ncbi:unnamed protein product [Sphagnum jensenii]|uniref:Uncharacterized protein n=1 Tax=Sphagnum jensenii TaxID=128206 RepID=A0ABP1BDP8_9BRYO